MGGRTDWWATLLIVPLVWLTELSGKPVMTLFISEVSWFDIHPPLTVAPDPFLIDVLIVSKQGRCEGDTETRPLVYEDTPRQR